MFFLLTSRNTLYQIAGVLNQNGSSPNSTSVLLLDAFVYITFYPPIPRFIISVRELYDRDLRGRWQEIDTGFSVPSRSNAGLDGTLSGMVFMDVSLVRHGPAVEGDMDDSDTISALEVGEEDMGLV
jgi:hypothetical protein